MTRFEVVNPDALPPPRGYNHGLLVPLGGRALLFIAGQLGIDREGRLVGAGFVEQFDRALENLLAVVRAAGGEADAIGKLTIFVTDTQEYLARLADVGRAYRRHMGRHFPAMSLVEVAALLEPGARVEIEGIAVVPARSPAA